MSSLWTPSGEHRPPPDRDPAPGAGGGTGGRAAPGPERGEADPALVEAEMRRVQAEIAATPAASIIANHAVGLWQLAVLHLTPAQEGGHPRLDESALAIDAFAALVESLGDRLGEHAEPLREALAQLRLAFVQVRERLAAEG